MNNIGATTSQQVQRKPADNGSHGKPCLDELVPSRYALRVGEIDVLVISDGPIKIPAASLPASFDQPDWHNAFEHDPEEAARVRVHLLRELAATGEPLVGTHLPFPSVCRASVAGNVFRWVPAFWDY